MVFDTLKIVVSPDPLLREVCDPCVIGDKSLKKLAKQMARTMYRNNGCGLAAPQVGVLQRFVVIDCDQENGRENPIYLVNPEILEVSGEMLKDDEGCLSCPGISVPVTRHEFARVRYYDLNGKEMIIEGDGLLGRCLQHEIDHLNGRTLFESCAPMDRIRALRDYDAAIAAGALPGDTGI